MYIYIMYSMQDYYWQQLYSKEDIESDSALT